MWRRGRVVGFDAGRLQYRLASGRLADRRLAEVERIEIAGWQPFTEAEALRAAGRYAEAAERYEDAARSAATAWQAALAWARAADAYDRAGDFAAAIRALIALAGHSPASAAEATPTNWPVAQSGFYIEALEMLDEAIRRHEGVLERAPDSQRSQDALDVLRRLRTRVATRAGDAAASRIEHATTTSPATSESDIGDESSVASLIRAAESALELKRYQQVVELADTGLAVATDHQAAVLLWLRGRALAERARSRDDCFEAALSLMRVVAHFPKDPLAMPCLYEVALLHEKAGLPHRAVPLLERVVARSDDEALRLKARERLQALRNRLRLQEETSSP